MDKLIFNVCFPVAEVKVIEATLSLTGYTPYVCDEEAEPVEVPPEEQVRYQRQTISANWLAANNFVFEQGNPFALWGPVSYGDGDGKTTKEVREVDPYTGLTCITGDVGFTVPSGFSEDEDQCTETTRVFTGDDITDPCDSENTITKTVTYDLSISYGVDQVATLVENMLNLFAWTDLPAYGTKGTVLPGTNGEKSKSALMVSPAGSSWSAAYIRSGTTVTKRKLYLKFLTAATYTKRTTTGGNVTEEVLEAEQGEEIEIDAPLTPDTTIEIFACQFLSECLLARVGSSEFSSKGESQKQIADPDWEPGEDECLLLYVSGDGRVFEQLQTSETYSESVSGNYSNEVQDDGANSTTTTTRNAGVNTTTTTVATPCATISVNYSGGGTRSWTSNGTIDGEDFQESCIETITASEEGFETSSSPEGCQIPDFECMECEETTQEGANDKARTASCECDGISSVRTYSEAFDGEGFSFSCSGTETSSSEMSCLNDSYYFSSEHTTTCQAFYSLISEDFQEIQEESYSSTVISSTTQTLINEMTDPFDKRGKVDGEPTESENITCASRIVSETFSTWTTVSDVKWELEIEPSKLRDTNGNPLEHTTYFQYILSEFDSEDPYCPELTYTEYYLPSDVRVPSGDVNGQVEEYELTFNGPNLSVSSPRKVVCIVHSQAIVEIAYDL